MNFYLKNASNALFHKGLDFLAFKHEQQKIFISIIALIGGSGVW